MKIDEILRTYTVTMLSRSKLMPPDDSLEQTALGVEEGAAVQFNR